MRYIVEMIKTEKNVKGVNYIKILLVGFKLSIGIEPYLDIIFKNLIKRQLDVVVCCEKKVAGKFKDSYSIGLGGNAVQMFKDTLNICNYSSFIRMVRQEKPDFVFFIASHTLNIGTTLLTKVLFPRITIISQIHDPIPHSGTSYGAVIYISQLMQCWLSNQIIVAGKKLKDMIQRFYFIPEKKVTILPLGTFREERATPVENSSKGYITVIGRIEDYKGIDIFLKAANQVIQSLNSNCQYKFLIAGAGNLQKYQQLAREIPAQYLEIRNYVVSDDEFDEILQSSYICVLPYKDGTQTGVIPLAYYNSCPVIVTNVGSLGESVINGETGYIIERENIDQLSEKIIELIRNKQLRKNLSSQAFNYYLQDFQWTNIVEKFINVLVKQHPEKVHSVDQK